jgi:tRNA uridine 5-carbamoylmethylation protein Kti12
MKNRPAPTTAKTAATRRHAEKQTHGALKSAFDRVSKTDRTLVIIDSQNYIKGFRYELHCISKATEERHEVLWVLNRLPVVKECDRRIYPTTSQGIDSTI